MSLKKLRTTLRRASSGDRIIDAVITDVEILSAKEFIKVIEERPQDVESSVFCPPNLGGGSFGSFKVKFAKSRLVAG